MFINIRHDCAFKENIKKFFVNNFWIPELCTLKFFTQKETMVMQISAALLSSNFLPGKIYAKKRTVFTF